jgi:hypothetical protein
MNRLDASVDAARRAMTVAGELPRGLVPNRERIETDQFSGEIYFNNGKEKPEWVATITFKTAEDRGTIEMIRAATKDDLIAELLRQVGELEIKGQDLSAPPRSKVHMQLADYDSPEDLLFKVEQGAIARHWLESPTGQMYTRLERASNSDRPYQILKEEMVRLGFWDNPIEFNEANLSYAFVNALNDGKFSYFEKRADRHDAENAETANADAPAGFQRDMPNPYRHINANSEANSDGTEALRTVKELPFKELKRSAIAQRYANKGS